MIDSVEATRTDAHTHQPRTSRMPSIDARDRLILALDFPFDEARRTSEQPVTVADVDQIEKDLDGLIKIIKIGWPTFMTDHAHEIIQRIALIEKRLFLDLKFSETTDTVRRYVARAIQQNAKFVTVNTSFRTVAAACDEAKQKRPPESDLQILTITLLTSMNQGDLDDMGIKRTVEEQVLWAAKKAVEVGCDGVIASGLEAAKIRETVGSDLLIVTPGIRPAGIDHNDQKRATTPGASIMAGSDYLVIGRPIMAAKSPRDATERILEEMQAAFDKR